MAVIGIGNRWAGDDGVGVEIVEALQRRLVSDPRVLLGVLEGDLLEVADWLPHARRFVFIDAVAGAEPGQTFFGYQGQKVWAASFHQTDLATALETLDRMGVIEPFPPWEIWGVTILPPREFRSGLSAPVAAAARHVTSRLIRMLKDSVPDLNWHQPALAKWKHR